MKKLILLTVLLSACVITFECSSSETGTSAKLEGTRWVLYELEGVKYTTPADGKTVFIKFDAAEMKMSGSASCNTIFGNYTAVKTADAGENVQLSLKFGPIASTEMFCNNVMDTETKFKAALEKTTQYKISKSKLYLYNDADKIILRLKS